MDQEAKAKLIALSQLPIASLTLVDVCFLLSAIDHHPDEVIELVPDLAVLREI